MISLSTNLFVPPKKKQFYIRHKFCLTQSLVHYVNGNTVLKEKQRKIFILPFQNVAPSTD